MPGLAAGSGHGAPDGFANRLDLDDVLFDHRIGRQWLDGVMLHPVTVAGSRQLEELYCGRTDIDAHQGRLAFSDQSHVFSPYVTGAYAHNVPRCIKSVSYTHLR